MLGLNIFWRAWVKKCIFFMYWDLSNLIVACSFNIINKTFRKHEIQKINCTKLTLPSLQLWGRYSKQNNFHIYSWICLQSRTVHPSTQTSWSLQVNKEGTIGSNEVPSKRISLSVVFWEKHSWFISFPSKSIDLHKDMYNTKLFFIIH